MPPGVPGMIQAHAQSETGPVRTVNEDSWLIQPDLGLYAVADGMGGHNAGEVASRLAIDALSGFVGRSATDSDLSWPVRRGPGPLVSGQSPPHGHPSLQSARVPRRREP